MTNLIIPASKHHAGKLLWDWMNEKYPGGPPTLCGYYVSTVSQPSSSDDYEMVDCEKPGIFRLYHPTWLDGNSVNMACCSDHAPLLEKLGFADETEWYYNSMVLGIR